jgi:signal transduction histidine kinase
MKKSIKTRLVKNFMLVIIISVVILEIVLTNSIKDYYYKNVENILSSQVEYSTDFYSRYFTSFDLQDIVIDDIDLFLSYTDAQVQVLSLEGELLMDSLGVNHDEPINTSDVLKAKNLEKGVWVGNVEYSNSSVMAVSVPLINNQEAIGIVRFISSLEETNTIIRNISFLLMGIGIIVIVISGLLSIFLANSIVKPLLEVTKVAEKMADGQLKVRSHIELEDEIGRLSNTLNYMAEELLKKEQIKNDFISSISHELRTPLTSIKGWAITIKPEENKDNELLIDGLEIIENESDRLADMVENLLDFSRFISGRIGLEKDIFNIRETLEMIYKQYMPRAKENQIEFKLNISDDINILLGDENRIKQILINLLDNALRFTDKDGEVILSSYIKDEFLVLEIKDNGMGIPEEDLPNVVEKFYKGKNSKSNSGIGLSICKEIVDLHEGKLIIESEENIGTLIKVLLPIKEENR